MPVVWQMLGVLSTVGHFFTLAVDRTPRNMVACFCIPGQTNQPVDCISYFSIYNTSSWFLIDFSKSTRPFYFIPTSNCMQLQNKWRVVFKIPWDWDCERLVLDQQLRSLWGLPQQPCHCSCSPHFLLLRVLQNDFDAHSYRNSHDRNFDLLWQCRHRLLWIRHHRRCHYRWHLLFHPVTINARPPFLIKPVNVKKTIV